MAKIFITGSTDGLGFLAAWMLLEAGHDVLLHARSQERADDLKRRLPAAKTVLVADLSDRDATRKLAEELNGHGRMDTVIHNAGVYRADSLTIFMVNVLAPYILTALATKPKRLVYLGSNMHMQGSSEMSAFQDKGVGYSDSKLLVLMLAKAIARKWPDCYVNTVDPGWVPTKMGGPGAPDDLQEGVHTQVWLTSADEASFTGRYLFHMKMAKHSVKADDMVAQEQLLNRCREISGIRFPTE